MNAELSRMVDEVLTRKNPQGDFVDPPVRLQQLIVGSGRAFSEEDIFAACEKLGLDNDQAMAFLEELASWY